VRPEDAGRRARQLALSLEEWRQVADAKGGFSLARLEPAVARDLTTRSSCGLARLGNVDLQTEDRTYKVSLEKLLAAPDSADPKAAAAPGS